MRSPLLKRLAYKTRNDGVGHSTGVLFKGVQILEIGHFNGC